MKRSFWFKATSIVAAVVLVLGGATKAAVADDLADLEAKLSAARQNAKTNQEQLNSVVEDLEHSDAELTAAYEKLESTRAQIPVAKAELDKANGEYEVAQREAAAIAEKLADAKDEKVAIADEIRKNEEDTERARRGIAQMARDFAAGNYRMTSVELMVGATDFTDVLADYNLSQTALRTEADAMQALREATAIATNMQVRLEATEKTIGALQDQADQNVITTKTAKDAAQSAKERLEQLEANQAAAAQTVEARRAAELERQDQLSSEADQLSNDIQKLIGLTKAERERLRKERLEQERLERERKERERKERERRQNSGNSGNSGGGGSTSTPAPEEPSKPPTSSKFLAYPVKNPVITSPYGMRFHPVLHYWRLHAGTDFRAYCGVALYAAASGKVEWAMMRGGFGNQVMINHGTVGGSNLMTSYNHLSRFAVRSGQTVKKGDVVGYSGATGTVTACHLHFEVYVNGNTVDPMTRL